MSSPNAPTNEPSELRLRKEIATVLNRHSAENGYDTPDFILASYLMGCLATWDNHVVLRDHWYGGRSGIERADICGEIAASVQKWSPYRWDAMPEDVKTIILANINRISVGGAAPEGAKE